MRISLHLLYVNSFIKFAKVSLDNSVHYNEIVSYANCLNEKANQILLRASLYKDIDTQKLQRELFESGREYIRKFAQKFNQNKLTDCVGENYNLKLTPLS